MSSASLPLSHAIPRDRIAGVAAKTGLVLVLTLAAVIRFTDFDRVYTTPYYDAAVRSMGLSVHNFFYGALEPGGQISIDKTPVDLWLQVLATKLFGYSGVTLRLPAAIAGVLAVLLVYDLVRRGFGRWAGLAAGTALAVLPTSVLTSRSDTMDVVMSALLLAAFWVIMAAPPLRRPLAVVAAGALAGLAWEIKLFEATIAIPALVLMAWLALDLTPVDKLKTLGWAGVAYVATAAAWPVVASLLPGQHPFAMGSSNGQIWNALLVYNGIQRFGNHATSATPPGLTRLFTAGGARDFGALIGVELAAALVFGALAVAISRGLPAEPVRADRPAWEIEDERRRRVALAFGLGAWLVIGTLIASFMGRQWPRYLEAFAPAVPAVLGISLVTIGRAAVHDPGARLALATCAVAAGLAGLVAGASPGTAVGVAFGAALIGLVLPCALLVVPQGGRGVLAGIATAAILVAALAVPVATSAHLVRTGAGDSARAGNMPAAKLDRLSAYLRHHQHGARYEVATASIIKAGRLVERDARPILVLAGDAGRQLVSTAQLRHDVRTGKVRYALLGTAKCVHGKGYACAPVVRWVRTHGRDVSRAAGFPTRGLVFRLGVPPGRPGAHRGAALRAGGTARRGATPRSGNAVHRSGATRPHGGRHRQTP